MSLLDILFGMGKRDFLFLFFVLLFVLIFVIYMVLPFDKKTPPVFVPAASSVSVSPFVPPSVPVGKVEDSINDSCDTYDRVRNPDRFESGGGFAVIDGERYELENGRYVKKSNDKKK